MNELIKLIQDKTGLSEDQARQAAETAVSFIKSRLPDALASQVDGALSRGSTVAGQAAGMIGSLFGNK